MLAGLFDDKQYFVARLREAHALCDRHGDVASARLIVNWIDDAKGSGENPMTPPLLGRIKSLISPELARDGYGNTREFLSSKKVGAFADP
jgi:hypothetical protein